MERIETTAFTAPGKRGGTTFKPRKQKRKDTARRDRWASRHPDKRKCQITGLSEAIKRAKKTEGGGWRGSCHWGGML